jgi:hypothetical protein
MGYAEDHDPESATELTPWQQLYVRVTDAMGSHDPGWDEKDILGRAFSEVEFGEGGIEALSPEGLAALERIEALPRTGWDDPADVPEDTPENF